MHVIVRVAVLGWMVLMVGTDTEDSHHTSVGDTSKEPYHTPKDGTQESHPTPKDETSIVPYHGSRDETSIIPYDGNREGTSIIPFHGTREETSLVPNHGSNEDAPHHIPRDDKEKGKNPHHGRGEGMDLLHESQWGRDPELCAHFFKYGASGKCPDSDTCCGVLNYTADPLRVDIYCCHDSERCCEGICCNDQTVCCRRRSTPQLPGYGMCCYKERGCCVDLNGDIVCCTTMLGRYWWVIAVSLTIYLVTKVTMMVRRYRAMPDIGEERLKEDRALKIRVRGMTYCC